MMRRNSVAFTLALLALGLSVSGGDAFAPASGVPLRSPRASSVVSNNLVGQVVASKISPFTVSSSRQSPRFLSDNNQSDGPPYDPDAISGQRRGIPLGLLVLAVVIWSFSVPPEFRRAHFCYSDRCTANRSRCYDCVTLAEWTRDVQTYYQNGGGIQWDFSIDPESPFLLENMRKKTMK